MERFCRKKGKNASSDRLLFTFVGAGYIGWVGWCFRGDELSVPLSAAYKERQIAFLVIHMGTGSIMEPLR